MYLSESNGIFSRFYDDIAHHIRKNEITQQMEVENEQSQKGCGIAFCGNGNSLAIVRANKWQQYKLGIEGELHWAVDCYSDSNNKYLSNVWTDLSTAKYIEGLLVYPLYSLYTNTLGLSDAQANDELMQKYSDRFASSIRLENISESIDDYDYLCYANQLINKCRIIEDDLDESVDLDSYVAKINKIYDTLFDDVNYDDNVTSEKITKAKNDLAGIITSLQ